MLRHFPIINVKQKTIVEGFLPECIQGLSIRLLIGKTKKMIEWICKSVVSDILSKKSIVQTFILILMGIKITGESYFIWISSKFSHALSSKLMFSWSLTQYFVRTRERLKSTRIRKFYGIAMLYYVAGI